MLRNKQKKLNISIMLMATLVVFSLSFAARASTIHLSDSGWSDSTVGTWDPATLTGTITTDVSDTIQIDSDGITLDGNGKNITGDGLTDCGVSLNGRIGVTIKNVNIQEFCYGIYLSESNSNTITGCTISNNSGTGIQLEDSNNNNFTNNTVTNNFSGGIYFRYSSKNTLTNNTVLNDVLGYGDGINLFYSENNTLTDNTISKYYNAGILLHNSDYSTLIRNTVINNRGCGICSMYSINSILTDNTVSNNSEGIGIECCDGITLMNNTISNNSSTGLYLGNSRGCTLSGNNMSENYYNLRFGYYYDNEGNIDITNTVDGKPIYYVKDAVDTVYDDSTNAGIFYAVNCDNITVKDLTLTKNGCGVVFINTTNSRIENVTVSDTDYGIYLNYSDNSTLVNNTVSNSDYGILVYSSNNSSLSNNIALNNNHGIYIEYYNSGILTDNTTSGGSLGIGLVSSSSNTLSENITANHSHYGIFLWKNSNGNILNKNLTTLNGTGIRFNGANNNTVKENTCSNNSYDGIYFRENSTGNQIYNNNFIDNANQATLFLCPGNIFNQPKPIGGNYWSDWTEPDDDGDWFVDYPYELGDAQDNLPWICKDGWIAPRAIQELVAKVLTLNLQHGIENELDSKLNAALGALDDINNNNDDAAINTLEAFITAVEAQSGKKISEADADELIASALEIIVILSS